LKLADDVVAEVRSGAAPAPTNGTDLREPPAGPAAAPAPGGERPAAPRPGNGNGNGHTHGNGATRTAQAAPAPVQSGALVGSIVERPFAGAPAAPSEAVLTEHFTRMSQFLTLETEVMKARFGGTLPNGPLSGAQPGMAQPAGPTVHPFVGD